MQNSILVELKKIVLLALVLMLLSTAIIGRFVRPVEASVTIYIKADGSVEPSTANITIVGNVTYTFTGNINGSIVVERDDIVVDGAGYTLQGRGVYDSRGIDLSHRNDVSIKNMEIRTFYYGILLDASSNNTISGNVMTENNWNGIAVYGFSKYNTISGNKIIKNKVHGIRLFHSMDNTVSGNNITSNDYYGILLDTSSNNIISGNSITANNLYNIQLDASSNYNTVSGNTITTNSTYGIDIRFSSNYNSVSGNSITDNMYGIRLGESSNYNTINENTITNNRNYGIWIYYSSNNTIFCNNFTDNTKHVHVHTLRVNFWDDGVAGNYWSDYEDRYPNATEIDNSGIWDTPYVIDENNADNYPIVPEFPTLTPMIVLLIVLTVSSIIYKRRLLKTPKH